jgi:hypothetical protein
VIRPRDSLAQLLIAWRRTRVRAALSRVDGTAEREQAVVDAYDKLVAAEPRGEWPA